MKASRPQRIEPEKWTLEVTSEDDKKLPKSPSVATRKKKIDAEEEQKLEMTKANGGLVKEVWRWVGGIATLHHYVVTAKPRNPF